MDAHTESAAVLFVADDPATTEAIDAGDWSVTAAAREETPAAVLEQSPACLLLSRSLGTEGQLECLRRVREVDPGVPVVAFADREIDRLIEAGITDVVRGAEHEVGPAEIERRIAAARALAERPATGNETPAVLPRLLRDVAENVDDVAWVNALDEEGLAYVDSTYEEVWGRSREPLYESQESLLETVHPEDRERVREAIDRRPGAFETHDVTYRVVRPDGELRWIHSRSVGVHEDGEARRVVGVATDITERKRREQQLEAQRDELSLLDHINRVVRGVDQALLGAQTREEAFQAACDQLAASDRYQFAVALEVVGSRLEPAAFTDGAAEFVDAVYPIEFDSLRETTSGTALDAGETQMVPRIHDDSRVCADKAAAFREAGVRSLATVPVEYGETQYGTVVVYSPREDAFGDRERAVFDELGETVGHAVAAVESRQREQTLASLYEATEAFLTAETQRDVAEVAVETARDVLGLQGIGVFVFENETNTLEPVAGTDGLLEEFCGGRRVFGPGRAESITWHTYVTGERRCFADVRESDWLANPETSARAALFIPLGEHGVFVAASDERGVFTEPRRRLVGLLAATTETALGRVAGEADVRERDAALEQRTRQIDRLEGLLSAGQDVSASIREARTRGGLETGLCDRLVEHDCVAFAWIGARGPGGGVEPRAWAGGEDGYLDAVSLVSADEPAVETAHTGQTTVVSDLTAHVRDRPWAREAVDRGYQSALAVPLRDGETDYGVLAVYVTGRGAVDERVAEVAGWMGSTVAYGINSVETRRATLEEETRVEVELGQTETLLNAVAGAAGEPVNYRELHPADGGSAQVLFSLPEPPVGEILALESEFVAVESLTHAEQDGEHRFRATLSRETVPSHLVDCGGAIETVTATPTETRATVRLSAELGVCEFLERLRAHYPEAGLRSTRDAVVDETGDGYRSLTAELTDRQREVLTTAYEGGFFQSPRETTGEELADVLGISQPTVSHHLREAQHRLLTALFEQL